MLKVIKYKIIIILLCLPIFACGKPGESGYGWKTIKCYNEGVLVHKDKWNHCPQFAGQGYSELVSGKIIKAVCRCTTGDF